MHSKPLVLCLSKNPELLFLRQRVLATRYDVVPVSSLEDLKTLPESSVFDILLLCHSLPEGECKEAIRLVRERWPRIKVMMIVTALSGCSEEHPDLLISALDGPAAMFSGIAQLLRTS